MRAPVQCAILIGGLGARLGALTADMPKPLLPVGGRPFLEYLLREAARFGFRRLLLLAGYKAGRVADYVAQSRIGEDLGLDIDVVVEPAPAGTGGALWLARDRLDDRFFLLNGDSWFDFNWLSLIAVDGADDTVATIGLRRLSDASRYGVVETEGSRVRQFRERPLRPGPGAVNSGVYLLSRRILSYLSADCSLEGAVFPKLAQAGLLAARLASGRFLDIGVPGDYEAAQTKIPQWRRRPAVFLDRDGTLNEDSGYVHRRDEFRWLPGAREAVLRLNEAGCYVFVVTNQAGVAHGKYGEAEVAALHRWMQEELRGAGAHIDDFRYCPNHPDGIVEGYAEPHPWRKPAPGMLLDLMARWPVEREGSVMFGDKDLDAQAGRAAGVAGIKIGPNDLLPQVERWLGERYQLGDRAPVA